ncbi:hypothetical protein [Quatrionicoccus australiensis]|uniref:hypothetical protein n=1 Tax=Quatrionicoccus australiensis TaxID=138118 RepID=UPI001CF80379|nr:hypothetical protein [Quatrionicoccus australiensis]UCV15098.1 hypothetical protein KI612_19645 [Quatrionicoccus australiensis]
MTREIIHQTALESASVAEQSGLKTHAEPAQTLPVENEQFRDTLAGVFPEWDLLPAVPFIRRVK